MNFFVVFYFIFYLLFIYLFSSSVIFNDAVFIVRKFTVISIVPIQYCLAHVNKLISVI